jgi:hypothetical protein
MGVSKYLKMFIVDFSIVAVPLNALTIKGNKFTGVRHNNEHLKTRRRISGMLQAYPFQICSDLLS